MDKIGRKIPSLVGLFIAGAATILNPVPSDIWPLYILRIALNTSVIPMLWSPYMVDYI